MEASRREFLRLGAMAGAAVAVNRVAVAEEYAQKAVDPDLCAVISDMHIGQKWSEQTFKTDRSYDYVNGVVKRLVDEILSLKVLPAYVFGLGDVALSFGEERDYELAEETFRPLADAGIRLVMTAGNHDRREPMARILGKWIPESPVRGRFASVTSMPKFDMVLLDSLKEPDPSAANNSAGRGGWDLGAEQTKWIESFMAESKRPMMVCAHHTAWALGINKAVVKGPAVCGFLHGHNHSWQDNLLYSSYGRKTMVRMLGMPSMGMDRDIGYALLRAFDDRVELTQVERDYYFPVMTAKEDRLPLWDCAVRERHGRRLSFPFDKKASQDALPQT